MVQTISFTLNGEKRILDIHENDILLDVLRTKLGITTPKCGCGVGDCGSCTIILNGKSVKSCLILAIEVSGQEIVTLEGLMKDGITPLQQTMIDNNAFQCGYCAPGMIVSSHELLQNNQKPSVMEIKESLAGNLCRCTGYTSIIDAVKKHVDGSESNE